MKMNQREFLQLCARGTYEEIEEAINNGASINRRAMFNGSQMYPLFVAVMKGNREAIEVLIKHRAKAIHGFMAAIIFNEKYLAQYMVYCGADVNSRDAHNRTPLLCAVTANNPEAVKWLIELGANVNIKAGEGYNVLTYAAFMFAEENEYDEQTVKIIRILMTSGADYREAMMAAIRFNDTELVRLFIQNGADVNEDCMPDRSPLTLALLNLQYDNDLTMLKFLLKNGAETNEEFDFGDGILTTNLNISISMNHPIAAEMLLDYGADPNFIDYKGRTPLMYGVLTGRDIAETLLRHGADPDIGDGNGRTALMFAAIDGEIEEGIIKDLLDAGADPDLQDDKGQTALMWAVADRDRSPEILISALIRTGGLRAEKGALWFSAAALFAAGKREAQLNIVKTLIQYGADLTICDNKGVNAFMRAVMNFDDEIAGILKSAGAVTPEL